MYTKKDKIDKEGFALIVALMITSLILVLILSMSSMLRVHIKKSEAEIDLSAARRNALFAMNVAIAQLQKFAGPDTRVSARADILGENVQNPYITAIWDTNDLNQTEPVYLICPNDSSDYGFGKSTSGSVSAGSKIEKPSNNNESVWLYKQGTESNWVCAPVKYLSEQNKELGSYSWWIGDEGIKSKVNIPNTRSVASDEVKLYDTLLPQKSSLKSLFNRNYNASNSDLHKIVQLSQLNYLLGVESKSDITNSFHDLTTHSYGLLTDAKNGGFKKDLTHIFENDSSYQKHFGSSSTKYFGDYSSSGFNNGFPGWSNLRSYYQLKDAVTNGAISPIAPSPNKFYGEGLMPYGTLPAHGDEYRYQENNPIAPIISRLAYSFGFDYYEVGGMRKLRVMIKPIIGLYNPYNIRINTNTYRIDSKMNPIFTVRLGGTGNTTQQFYLGELLPSASGVNAGFRFQISNIDFRPGETRYFSLANSVQFNTTDYIELDNNLNSTAFLWLNVEDAPVAAQDGPEGQNDSSLPKFGLTANEQSSLDVLAIQVNAACNVNTNIPNIGNLWMKDLGNNFYQYATNNYQWDNSKTIKKQFSTLPDMRNNNPFAHFAYWLRTAGEDTGVTRTLLDANIRAVRADYRWDGLANSSTSDNNDYETTSMYSASVQGMGSDTKGLLTGYEPQIFDFNRYNGYYGRSNEVEGSSSVILFDVPRTRIASIAALQHANISQFSFDPSFLVGHSFSNYKVDRNKVVNTSHGSQGIRVYDWAYILNEALWDEYYFTTVPTTLSEDDISKWKTGTTDFLINSRLKLHNLYGQSTSRSDFDGSVEDSRSITSRLLLNGAFNINSTSVEAWKIFLSSMQDSDIARMNSSTGAIDSYEENSSVRFSKFSTAIGSSYNNNGSSSNFWNGYRTLNTDQIDTLSHKIVEQVRLRGPFKSLSSFVNRKLINESSDTNNLGLKGALQTALDDASVNINVYNEEIEGPRPSSSYGAGHFTTGGESQAAGFAGYLTQADILQNLGPMITVRSDTFRIRACGMANDKKQKVWCEAVVQRVPDVVGLDRSSNLTETYEPSNKVGRKFKIVFFRWLKEGSI